MKLGSWSTVEMVDGVNLLISGVVQFDTDKINA